MYEYILKTAKLITTIGVQNVRAKESAENVALKLGKQDIDIYVINNKIMKNINQLMRSLFLSKFIKNKQPDSNIVRQREPREAPQIEVTPIE